MNCPLIPIIAFAVPKAKLPYLVAFPFPGQSCNGAETGICLLFNQLFVRIYVHSAMEALAQEEEGHPVHVEVVAAAGAAGQGRNGSGDAEEDHPDDKGHGRLIERLGHLEGRPHGGHIDEDHPPQTETPLPDLFHGGPELRRISGVHFFQFGTPGGMVPANSPRKVTRRFRSCQAKWPDRQGRFSSQLRMSVGVYYPATGPDLRIRQPWFIVASKLF